jgi:hypothetical protein
VTVGGATVPAAATMRPPSPLLVGGLTLLSVSVFPLPQDGCAWRAVRWRWSPADALRHAAE